MHIQENLLILVQLPFDMCAHCHAASTFLFTVLAVVWESSLLNIFMQIIPQNIQFMRQQIDYFGWIVVVLFIFTDTRDNSKFQDYILHDKGPLY